MSDERKNAWGNVSHLDGIERETRRDLENCNIYNSSLKHRRDLRDKLDRVHDEKRYWDKKYKESC